MAPAAVLVQYQLVYASSELWSVDERPGQAVMCRSSVGAADILVDERAQVRV